jgi:hypothetical protein
MAIRTKDRDDEAKGPHEPSGDELAVRGRRCLDASDPQKQRPPRTGPIRPRLRRLTTFATEFTEYHNWSQLVTIGLGCRQPPAWRLTQVFRHPQAGGSRILRHIPGPARQTDSGPHPKKACAHPLLRCVALFSRPGMTERARPPMHKSSPIDHRVNECTVTVIVC